MKKDEIRFFVLEFILPLIHIVRKFEMYDNFSNCRIWEIGCFSKLET